MKIIDLLKEHQTVMSQIENMIPLMDQAVDLIVQAINRGGKVLLMGNGGSAADAQHLAAELICRFKAERRALPAIALTTDTSILTAVSNDYDYSHIFSRQIEALCQPNDVVIGISTSGNSKNILMGMEAAKKIGSCTIGFTGEAGKLKEMVDVCFCVPSKTVARIQEAHIFIGHSICEMVENKFVVRSLEQNAV